MQHIIKILTHCIFRDDHRCFTVMLVLLHLEILLLFVCLSFFRLIYLLLCLFILCLSYSPFSFLSLYLPPKYLLSLNIFPIHLLEFLYLSPVLQYFSLLHFPFSILLHCLSLCLSTPLFLSVTLSLFPFLFLIHRLPHSLRNITIQHFKPTMQTFLFLFYSVSLSPLSLFFPHPPHSYFGTRGS